VRRAPIRSAGVPANSSSAENISVYPVTTHRSCPTSACCGSTRSPPGRRPRVPVAVELLAACGFVITMVQTAEAVAKVVQAVRALARKYAELGQPVRLTVGGEDVDLAEAGDDELGRVVQVLVSRPAVRSARVRSALVVANDRYDDVRLAQLRSPSHDAAALVRVLSDPGIGGFDVELLENADERTLRRRIAAFFADRDRDDVLLLHFSCHGVKDVRGRLHLAARDTDLSVLGATAIPASFVNDLLADTHSRRVVLILDCCYSGAFARGTAVRSGAEVQIADEFGAGGGRIVLTASSATEYAFEGNELTRSEGQPSAFTGALVTGLESGAADLDADGEITIDELYDYTYRTVRQSTPGQAPMKWSFGVEGNLVVARSVRPAALPSGIEEDLASDRVVLRLEAVRALADLLRAARPGVRAAARARLVEVRDGDDSARVRQASAVALEADPSPTDAPAAAPTPTTAPKRVAAPKPVTVSQPVTVPEPRRPAPDRLSSVDKPAPSRVDASSRVDKGSPPDRSVPAILAALLTVAANVCYLVANAKDHLSLADSWYTLVIGVPELVGAVALVVTRRSVWAGLLAGLFSFDLLWLGMFPQGTVREQVPGWVLLLVAALAAGTAQLLALAVTVRGGMGRPWPRSWTWAALGAVILTGCALFTAIASGDILVEAFDLTPDDFHWAGLLGAVCCALAVPVAVLATRSARTAYLLLAAWMAAAVNIAGNDVLGGHAPKSDVYGTIGTAAVTAALGCLSVALLWRRTTPVPGSRRQRNRSAVHPVRTRTDHGRA
jgi:Caspase domain